LPFFFTGLPTWCVLCNFKRLAMLIIFPRNFQLMSSRRRARVWCGASAVSDYRS
jgi:hypothetical protein